MTPATTNRFLDLPLRDWIDLPYLDRVLDPASLSETLGRPVRLHRLRVKPGRSVLVGWEDLAGPGPDRYGWAAVLADADKSAGIVRRAARAGVAVSVHEAGPDGSGRSDGADSSDGADNRAALLSGGLDSDPGLARELAHARRALPTTAGVELLAYNPGRRVVLAVDLVPGEGAPRQVVRVGADRQDHLVGLARRWRGFGVPTLPVRRVGRRGTAVVSPWWGRGDLADLPEPAAAEQAGRVIAQLHRASRAAHQAPVDPVPPVVGVITELLPALAGRLARLSDALSSALGGKRSMSLVHGDLSPDQVLWDGEDEIRIVDLDRSELGSAGSDMGSWLAASTLSGQPELAERFVAGHRSVLTRATKDRSPSSRELAGWCGRALLASALEPFRRADPDWRQHVAARIALADDVVAGRGGVPWSLR